MKDQVKTAKQIFLPVLVEPEVLKTLNIKQWELVIRYARHTKLLGYLSVKVDHLGFANSLPQKIVEQFQGARQLVDYRKRLILWELNRLVKVLESHDINIVALKGGAYLLLSLPMSEGRLLSDIDILVNKKEIEKVEKILLDHGWVSTNLDSYDQYYYRTWMHELPPMRHQDRFVEVDIHHTILPMTSRLRFEAGFLLKDAVDIDEQYCKVLSPCDMVLHSAVHLFYDAELNASDFRDLVDIHELLIFFSNKLGHDFWQTLTDRAWELKLYRPLYYALYFSQLFLHTPIPDGLLLQFKGQPSFAVKKLMDYLVPLALLPEHPDFTNKKVAFARWLLYIRSHYLRMPLSLLLPHLFKKSKRRFGY